MYLKGTIIKKEKKKENLQFMLRYLSPISNLANFTFNINFWEWEWSRELKVDMKFMDLNARI